MNILIILGLCVIGLFVGVLIATWKDKKNFSKLKEKLEKAPKEDIKDPGHPSTWKN